MCIEELLIRYSTVNSLPAGTGGSTVLAGALAGAHALGNQAAEPVLYANRFVCTVIVLRESEVSAYILN